MGATASLIHFGYSIMSVLCKNELHVNCDRLKAQGRHQAVHMLNATSLGGAHLILAQ